MTTNLTTKSGTGNPIAENVSTKETASEEINTSNSKAIYEFFILLGDDTRSEFAKFILNMFTSFLEHEKEEGFSYTWNYKEDVFMMTRMLNDLIQSLKMPQKEAS